MLDQLACSIHGKFLTWIGIFYSAHQCQTQSSFVFRLNSRISLRELYTLRRYFPKLGEGCSGGGGGDWNADTDMVELEELVVVE